MSTILTVRTLKPVGDRPIRTLPETNDSQDFFFLRTDKLTYKVQLCNRNF